MADTDKLVKVGQLDTIVDEIVDKFGETNGRLDEQGEDILELQEGGYIADQQQIGAKINAWLNDHPEATTTVQDGSLTEAKLSNALRMNTLNHYIVPEMFGAIGDGVTDDTTALQSAIDYAYANKIPLFIPSKTYATTLPLLIKPTVKIVGENRYTSIIKKTTHDVYTEMPSGLRTNNTYYNFNAIFLLVCPTNFQYTWFRYFDCSNITLEGIIESADDENVMYGISNGMAATSELSLSYMDIRKVSYGIVRSAAGNSHFLSYFFDLYIRARKGGIACYANLCSFDRIFVELTTEYGLNLGQNFRCGAIGVSNARGGSGFKLTNGSVDVISMEECTGLQYYVEMTGKVNINFLSCNNITEARKPSTALLRCVSGNALGKVGAINLGGSTEGIIPNLVKFEASGLLDIGTIYYTATPWANLKIGNIGIRNVVKIDGVTQYKPVNPLPGDSFVIDGVLNIYNGTEWVPITAPVSE